jgi:hypothetical protein
MDGLSWRNRVATKTHEHRLLCGQLSTIPLFVNVTILLSELRAQKASSRIGQSDYSPRRAASNLNFFRS